MKYWEESLFLALEAMEGEVGLNFWDHLSSDQCRELGESLCTSAEMEHELNSYTHPSVNDLIDDRIRGITRNYEDELSRRNKREADYEATIERLQYLLKQAQNNSCQCS